MANIKEIWKDVHGYEGYYKVSDLGRIKSLRSFSTGSKILKPRINTHGYYQVNLTIPKKKYKSLSVHRLIALSFIPNPENKPCINHINNIRSDNRISNLEWCTYSENTLHSFKSGRVISEKHKLLFAERSRNFRGGKHPQAKKVICTKTNTIYGSIGDAAKAINVCRAHLNYMLLGYLNNTSSLKYYLQDKFLPDIKRS